MTCKTMPDPNKCEKYGKDHDFVKWKWKPHGCHLPCFDPEQFLNAVRGKHLAFVGDSVARNHKDSLLCLLSQVESPQNTYNDEENQITKWYFQTYNFTLIHLWTKFFVRTEERKVNGSKTETGMYIDELDPIWVKHVHEANYVVVSGGHWFYRQLYLYRQNKLIGTVYEQSQKKDLPELGQLFTVQNAFRTALNYLNLKQHYNYTASNNSSTGTSSSSNVQLVIGRTFSPRHFESGDWNEGGSCKRTRPNLELGPLKGAYLEMRNMLLEEIERVQNGGGGGGVRFASVDVTWMMDMRPDAHPGPHWDNRWNRGLSDCTHWCMPGPVDTWNQLLFLTLQKYT